MIAQQKDQRLVGIGQRLKEFRKLQGYRSQEAFASAVGSTRAAIAAYEIGKVEPTGAFLHNLSTKFGADINYILTGKSEQELPDLDAYLSRLGIDEMMKAIIKGYMKLPESKRKTVRDFIESLAAEIAAEKANPPPAALPKVSESAPNAAEKQREPPAPQSSDSDKPELDPEIEADVAKYRARKYAQEKTRRILTGSTDSAAFSENKKSRP